MGTNYYAETSVHGVPVRLHIGKSSAGWKFLFAEYDNLRSWSAWQKFLMQPGVKVVDEYDEPLAVSDLERIVENKQQPENLNYRNAPATAWGDYNQPIIERSKHERLDDDGYRFSTSKPDDWS